MTDRIWAATAALVAAIAAEVVVSLTATTKATDDMNGVVFLVGLVWAWVIIRGARGARRAKRASRRQKGGRHVGDNGPYDYDAARLHQALY